MALKANQNKRGTQREKSSPDVARKGRDSFLKKSGTIGHPSEKSTSDVSRTGRRSGTGPVGPTSGIGRGNADKGSGDGAGRIPDGVGRPLPSP